MCSDFDNIIPRYNTKSIKWDSLKERYGQEDLLPLWVADMDFQASPSITNAIMKRVGHPIYGYSFISDEYYNSIIKWMERRHNWEVEKDWIVFTPGVVTALSYAIKACTNPGDSIIIQAPVYHPFRSTIESNNRDVVINPLIYQDGRYNMDFEDLERKIDNNTKMLILCSPHNPVGRVWTKEELCKLSDICLKHDIIIVSDEIHFDLIYKGYVHTVLANISTQVRDNCIVCTAPSKTFNLAGIQVSNIIIPNKEIREKYCVELEKDHIVRPNVFGQDALIAAYNESEKWLDSLIEYLEGNKDFFIDFIQTRIPQLKVVKPEGTYLLWVDCSGLDMNKVEINDFFLNKCKLALNEGQIFGEEGNMFQRFNIGCPRSVLEETLLRIEKAVKEIE